MSNNQQVDRQHHPEDDLDVAIQKRREALKKLGKFSMYATPVALGMVSQTAVATSNNIFNA